MTALAKQRVPDEAERLAELLARLPADTRDEVSDDILQMVDWYRAEQARSRQPAPDVRPELDQMCEAAVDLVVLIERFGVVNLQTVFRWADLDSAQTLIDRDHSGIKAKDVVADMESYRARLDATLAGLRDLVGYLHIAHRQRSRKRGPKTATARKFVAVVAAIIEVYSGDTIEWTKKDTGSLGALLVKFCRAVDPTIGPYTIKAVLEARDDRRRRGEIIKR